MENSHTLKIIGSCELPSPINLGKEYKITVLGGITKISKKDLENGDYEFSYSLKLLTAEMIDETGKAVKLKDKTKASVKLRMAIDAYKIANGIEMDSEEFYQNAMARIMDFDNLVKLLK